MEVKEVSITTESPDEFDEMSSIYSLTLNPSASASASPNIMDTIQSESERRKVRALEMRYKRSKKNKKSKSSSSPSSNKNNNSNNNNNNIKNSSSTQNKIKGRLRSSSTRTNGTTGTNGSTRSIMIVRTLQESLATTEPKKKSGHYNLKKVVGNKHKRSVLRRRLNSSLRSNNSNSLNNSSSSSSSNSGIISETGSFSSMTSLSNVSTQNFEVKFEDVTVREYNMIPGDNPSVARGPPITIEWDHAYEQSHEIDVYESLRQKNRRCQQQMKMPPHVREYLLTQSGYSFASLREYSREATIIRRQRLRSIEMLHTDNVGEKIEKIKRAVKKPFKSRGNRKEERILEAYYRPEKAAGRRNGGSDKNNSDLDTTKRADNRSGDLTTMFTSIEGPTDPLDVSNSGRKYDLLPVEETSNDALDISNHPLKKNVLSVDPTNNGKKYDLLGDQNNTASAAPTRRTNLNDLDTSRHAKKYDLLGNLGNQDVIPDLDSSSDSSTMIMTKKTANNLENVSRSSPLSKKKRRSSTRSLPKPSQSQNHRGSLESLDSLDSLDSSSRMRKINLG